VFEILMISDSHVTIFFSSEFASTLNEEDIALGFCDDTGLSLDIQEYFSTLSLIRPKEVQPTITSLIQELLVTGIVNYLS
jgi:hypothetical protein